MIEGISSVERVVLTSHSLPPLMVWKTNKQTVDQQQTSSKLSLVLQRSFNQQPLTCVAENPRISPWNSQSSRGKTSAASKQTTIRLDVHCE